MARKPKTSAGKAVATLTHDEAKRKNIPTAEYEAVVEDRDKLPIRVAIDRRNRDLDPQLVWRGKDEQDASDLVVQAPPLYIQEKVHPKALIDDLLHETSERATDAGEIMPNLFADFNGLPKGVDKTEFYKHDQNWSNRMILGDSLQVMASLAEREGLRGKVQCIYIDPPYGIKFNSNFQWSTTSRDIKDGVIDQITREPEQVKAFRDTWRDGVHTYLAYLRDRFTVARDLLSESGSIFVQISDENVHRVRDILDEVFGEENFISQIAAAKTSGLAASDGLAAFHDYVLHYARKKQSLKFRGLYVDKTDETESSSEYFSVQLDDGRRRRMTTEERDGTQPLPAGARVFRVDNLTKPGPGARYDFPHNGRVYSAKGRWWGTTQMGLERIQKAGRIHQGGTTISFVRFLDDFPVKPINNFWRDVMLSSRAESKVYVVQSSLKLIQRCILMSTDPGDLVLDPTCGSGTTAVASEHWGRRWIVIDTSRVALALARARVMGARYPYYVLADSEAGRKRQAELDLTTPEVTAVHGDIRRGFVYERVSHVTMKSIANDREIDIIWNRWSAAIDMARENLNAALGTIWQEWEVPNDPGAAWTSDVLEKYAAWAEARRARQREIDRSIASRAEYELLYDRPYEDKGIVRVAGPFTVESLSPHRMAVIGTDNTLIDPIKKASINGEVDLSFSQMILENLKTAGVQQAHKDDKIEFTSLVPWPGSWICAEGRYLAGGEIGSERRAGIFTGPEFGTVTRTDLVAAAREAADAGFDMLIACAFNYEAHTTEFNKLGKLTVLKARMNADLHMSDELKNTGKGNLFVVFGEPDINLTLESGDKVRIKINGVDVFHPSTGEVRSDGPDGIACWFIDTDYNEESFFVRHAYFLGANDPYGALKTTLKSEIDEEGWESLHSDTSRAFSKPKSGRIAVKVINHLGDEVMKIFKVA